jgi:hypothetical protein
MPVRTLAAALMRPCGASRNGLWRTARCWVERREARLFERERRTTFEVVLPLAVRGVRIIDRRADGSVLELWVSPVTGICASQPVDSACLSAEPPSDPLLEGLLVKDVELTVGSHGRD